MAAPIDPQSLALYEKLVATRPGVERKGATMPYTSHRGHMFSFLADGGTLSLRLPVDALATFLAKYRTRLSEQHGAVMKEYAVVPAALLRKTAELAEWFAQSHAYVAALPPKAPTSAKKKSGAKKSGAKKNSGAK